MEIAGCILNIFAFVWLTVYYPIYLSRFFKLKGFNPIYISFIITAPIVLFKTFIGPAYILELGLFNKYFNFAILMTNISMLINFIMTVLILRTYKNCHYTNAIISALTPKWRINKNRLVFLSYIFLTFAFISFIFLTYKYGLINWILNPRGGYQHGRSGMGAFYALTLLFLSVSYSFKLLSAKNTSRVFISAILYISFVWFLGSKEIMLNFFAFTFVILWFRKYKHTMRIAIYGMPFIFVILLMNFGNIEFNEIANYFDYYINSANYYEAYFNGQIDLYYGEISATSWWSIVPRGLFPDKPYVYGFTIVNEFFFPGAAESTNYPAFGGPIASFADFGVIGVVLSSIFNWSLFLKLFCYHIIFNKASYNTIISNPLHFVCFLYLFAPNFLHFFPFPLSFIALVAVISIFSFSNRAVLYIR